MAFSARSLRSVQRSRKGEHDPLPITLRSDGGGGSAILKPEVRYRVNYDKLEQAAASLSELILTLQGDGDYDGVGELVAHKRQDRSSNYKSLDRLSDASIPVDVVF